MFKIGRYAKSMEAVQAVAPDFIIANPLFYLSSFLFPSRGHRCGCRSGGFLYTFYAAAGGLGSPKGNGKGGFAACNKIFSKIMLPG